MSAEASDRDQQFMRRAIRLAMNGRGRVEPNPMVGCVIVAPTGQILGEGYHEQFGGPHAEPNALADCVARGHTPKGATAYVTLEPCCHVKKKTPPCVPRLIEAGIGRVVVGAVDPHPEVSGRGIQRLRKAGIDVVTGVLEDECKQLACAFFANFRELRPYVTLKWAQTADAKVAGAGGRRIQISNPRTTHFVHELRSRCDAILVGINTVLSDDPLLTPREVKWRLPLMRAVLDRNLRTPVQSKLVQSAAHPIDPRVPLEPLRNDEVVIFCSEDAAGSRALKVRQLEEHRVELIPVVVNSDGRLSLSQTLRQIGHLRANLLVEPGPTLARSFLKAGLADRVLIIRSPVRVDDPSAPEAPQLPPHYVKTAELGLDGDVLTEYLNPKSYVFFAARPSADMVLAAEERQTS